MDYADWEYFSVGRCLLGSFVTFYGLVYYFKCCGSAEDYSGYDQGNKQQCVNVKMETKSMIRICISRRKLGL